MLKFSCSQKCERHAPQRVSLWRKLACLFQDGGRIGFEKEASVPREAPYSCGNSFYTANSTTEIERSWYARYVIGASQLGSGAGKATEITRGTHAMLFDGRLKPSMCRKEQGLRTNQVAGCSQ